MNKSNDQLDTLAAYPSNTFCSWKTIDTNDKTQITPKMLLPFTFQTSRRNERGAQRLYCFATKALPISMCKISSIIL